MKQKMNAIIAVILMIALCFGVTALNLSNDSSADSLIINEASGTVDYIPNTVNVSCNGSASFVPTINWNYSALGAYSIAVTTTVTLGDSSASSDGSGTAVHEDDDNNKPIIGYSVSDNNIKVIVGKGTTNVETITVTGVGTTTTADSFAVTCKATISVSNDSQSSTAVATRTTGATPVSVNVYSQMSTNTPQNDTCYFGEAYSYNLSSMVTGGSGSYVFAVKATSNSTSGVDFTHSGLYVLGGYIAGTSVKNAYSTQAVGNGNPTSYDGATYSLAVTIVDKFTGASASADLTLNMEMYKVTASLVGTLSGESKTYSSMTSGAICQIDQGTQYTVKLNFDNVGSETKNVVVTVNGMQLTSTNGEYVITDAANIILGTNTCTVTYSVDGYTYSFGFYVDVIATGAEFVVPDPSITVTLMG
ncbi:MAG: hypothetical protein WCQ63_03945 [Methanomethylophilus sp.]